MAGTYSIKFPRQVFSGAGSVEELAGLAASKKAKNVCLVTDRGIYDCGIAKKPIEVLEKAGVSVLVKNEVPTEPSVYELTDFYNELKDKNIDMMVAIGGGSVIDITKMTAALLTNPEFAKDIRKSENLINDPIPMVAIPTTSGTGAETTANAIFLFPEEDLKVGIVDERLLPSYVILDVTLTTGLPPKLTASTGVDALCHAMEAYISILSNPFVEMLAQKAIQLICRSIEKAFADGSDLAAREDMQLGAFYAGLCLTTASTVAVHALSYPLGGKYHIPHGVSNAILLPHVMDLNLPSCREQYTALAPFMVPEVEKLPKEEWPEAVVSYLYGLMKKLEIPDSLLGFGVKPEDLDYLTENAVKVERLLLKNPKKLTKEEIKSIYEKLLK